jgi:hypothetical protein
MSAGRIVLLVVGILFILISIGAMFAGSAVVWASGFKKDADGFHVTDPLRINSGTYAVISDAIEFDEGASRALNWLGLDKIKVEVENDDPSQPVFVGIARSRDVDAYLDDVKHDEITKMEIFDSSFDYDRQPGDVQPGAPGTQDFWLEDAEGRGPQEIVFDIEEGEFTILAMNADASEGVDMEAIFGIKSSGVILLVGIVFLVIGIMLLVGGVIMVVFGARTPRGQKTASVPPPPPAA